MPDQAQLEFDLQAARAAQQASELGDPVATSFLTESESLLFKAFGHRSRAEDLRAAASSAAAMGYDRLSALISDAAYVDDCRAGAIEDAVTMKLRQGATGNYGASPFYLDPKEVEVMQRNEYLDSLSASARDEAFSNLTSKLMKSAANFGLDGDDDEECEDDSCERLGAAAECLGELLPDVFGDSVFDQAGIVFGASEETLKKRLANKKKRLAKVEKQLEDLEDQGKSGLKVKFLQKRVEMLEKAIERIQGKLKGTKDGAKKFDKAEGRLKKKDKMAKKADPDSLDDKEFEEMAKDLDDDDKEDEKEGSENIGAYDADFSFGRSPNAIRAEIVRHETMLKMERSKTRRAHLKRKIQKLKVELRRAGMPTSKVRSMRARQGRFWRTGRKGAPPLPPRRPRPPRRPKPPRPQGRGYMESQGWPRREDPRPEMYDSSADEAFENLDYQDRYPQADIESEDDRGRDDRGGRGRRGERDEYDYPVASEEGGQYGSANRKPFIGFFERRLSGDHAEFGANFFKTRVPSSVEEMQEGRKAYERRYEQLTPEVKERETAMVKARQVFEAREAALEASKGISKAISDDLKEQRRILREKHRIAKAELRAAKKAFRRAKKDTPEGQEFTTKENLLLAALETRKKEARLSRQMAYLSYPRYFYNQKYYEHDLDEDRWYVLDRQSGARVEELTPGQAKVVSSMIRKEGVEPAQIGYDPGQLTASVKEGKSRVTESLSEGKKKLQTYREAIRARLKEVDDLLADGAHPASKDVQKKKEEVDELEEEADALGYDAYVLGAEEDDFGAEDGSCATCQDALGLDDQDAADDEADKLLSEDVFGPEKDEPGKPKDLAEAEADDLLKEELGADDDEGDEDEKDLDDLLKDDDGDDSLGEDDDLDEDEKELDALSDDKDDDEMGADDVRAAKLALKKAKAQKKLNKAQKRVAKIEGKIVRKGGSMPTSDATPVEEEGLFDDEEEDSLLGDDEDADLEDLLSEYGVGEEDDLDDLIGDEDDLEDEEEE